MVNPASIRRICKMAERPRQVEQAERRHLRGQSVNYPWSSRLAWCLLELSAWGCPRSSQCRRTIAFPSLEPGVQSRTTKGGLAKPSTKKFTLLPCSRLAMSRGESARAHIIPLMRSNLRCSMIWRTCCFPHRTALAGRCTLAARVLYERPYPGRP